MPSLAEPAPSDAGSPGVRICQDHPTTREIIRVIVATVRIRKTRSMLTNLPIQLGPSDLLPENKGAKRFGLTPAAYPGFGAPRSPGGRPTPQRGFVSRVWQVRRLVCGFAITKFFVCLRTVIIAS